MKIEFDPVKDVSNTIKHGISLARAVDMEPIAYVKDLRFDEPRFRLFGKIDGVLYCFAGTERGTKIRAISLRRAHQKEVKRYEKR